MHFLVTPVLLTLAAIPESAQEPQPTGVAAERNVENSASTCLQPEPMVRWEDYHGPYQKLVGAFARKLERKSAHPTHYKAGTVYCSLEVKDKFKLFVEDTFDPISFLSAGVNAGFDQASNRDPTFGQGAEGYGKRFGADFAGQTN